MKNFIERITQALLSRSLQRRMMMIFSIMLILPILCVSYFSYASSKQELEQKMQETTRSSVDLLHTTIQEIVGSTERNISQLSQQISSPEVSSKPAEVRTLIELFVKEHPELEILTVGNNNGDWMKAPDPGAQEYDPRTRDWYKASINNPGKITIIDPFASATTGNYNLYVSKTLADGQGAMTASINLAHLGDVVKQIKLGKDGYIYIADRNHKFVTHPTKKAGEDIDPEVVKLLKNGNGEMAYVNPDNGGQMRGFYTTDEATGFIIVGVLATEEFADASLPILYTGLTVLGIALVAALVLMYLAVRTITKPILMLNHSARRVSEGHLNEQIQIKRKDEIGQLAENYNLMVSSLRGIVVGISETSSQLSASSQELSATTEENSRAVEYVTELVQDSLTGAETQTAAMSETSRAMEEMSSGIQKIAEAAASIVDSSGDTVQDVQTGSLKVEQVSRQMDAIRESTLYSSGLIGQLNGLNAQVSEMSSAISNIAVQTNLLSLNAGIEAARAGEHGRGFAVVATEVRKLADQSKSTAGSIQETIEQMTKLINQSYDAMHHRVSADVELGIQVTTEAKEAFSSIEQSTSKISGQIHDISAITEQMSAGAEEIAASVQEIAGISRTTSDAFQSVTAATEEQLASMQEITSSSNELSAMAGDLQQKIEHFNLED